MQKVLLLTAASLFAAPLSTISQTAPVPLQVRLTCYDLLIHPAEARRTPSSIRDGLRFSSQGRFATPNDEAAFAPPDVPSTHWGSMFFTDGQLFETFAFNFEMSIPGRDANSDGVFDLLQYSQSVPSTLLTGFYFSDDFGDGTFDVTWTKNANSHTGTCQIKFDFLPNVWIHTFEILNYSATWTSAVKEGTTVHGPITLTRSGVPASTLSGELAVSTAQQGVVKLLTTSLKDENNSTFEWAPPITMDLDGTEFYEFLAVTDGWLYEPTPDFMDWLIVIDDKNDFDGDGQPNLIDPPTDLPPTAPSMQIIKTPNGIQLVVTGDLGKPYTLESASALPAATWSNATTVTLTTSPQTIDLPAPTTSMFWRMRFP